MKLFLSACLVAVLISVIAFAGAVQVGAAQNFTSFTGIITSDTTPSVPVFTAQPVGPSYTVPTTYSLNSTTGQIVAQIGYHVAYSAVNITIKNQPFTPYANANGIEISFYYNIQIKDHNEADNWTDLYNPEAGYAPQSDSDYTTISIPVNIGQTYGIQIPVNTQTDIQVQAMIGYTTSSLPPYNPFTYQFVGETSSWSPTQTVTITATPLSSTPTPSSSPTPTPNQTISASPKNPISIYEILIVALVVLIVAFVIVISVFIRGKRR